MASSKLVGDYQSDSDNDDSEHRHRPTKLITTDWTQCTDASSGMPYYWNIVTKDVTWEMPEEYRRFLNEATLRNSQSHKKWILCYTDDNAPYYFNEITREISWEKPADFVESSSSLNCDTIKRSQNNSNNRNTGDSNEGLIRVTTKTNLVPEYNSDDSDDENLKPSETPLFPASTSSSNSYPTNSQLIKSIEIPNELNTQSETPAPRSPKKEEKKEKPSFASIITGGRSPQHETIDIKLYTGEDETEVKTSSRPEENSRETEILPQKTFQRKRRIEFNVGSAPTKRPNKNEHSTAESEPTKENANSITALKNKYSNFQKGGTEFLEKQSSGSDDTEIGRVDEASNQIRDEQQLLEAKLNFLCQGKSDVSPVQIIQIQLQALNAANAADALHSAYLLEWMKNISNDLIKLECDAAPNGWKCLWNREKAQYYYENATTGEIKWEYPLEEDKEEEKPKDTQENDIIDDDAMDICTTPPPNEHEDLSTAYYQSSDQNADYAPPPPKLIAGCETMKNNNEKPLDDELASFYSDIAKLEPETANEENSCDKSSPNPDQPPSPENSDADDKKKKKKKKTKKLEPWRFGNLENWIEKWQKAQKELDG